MKKRDVFFLLAGIVLLAAAVLFAIPGAVPFEDETIGALVADTVPRAAAAGCLVLLMARCGSAEVLRAKCKAGDAAWAIPCLLVALVNFPLSALISGRAAVVRPELIPLFVLKCAAIAVFEEIFFRGILLPVLLERLRKARIVLAVLISSACFGLMHLLNLFFGAGIGDTLLQIGYTFLIGCMLAVTMVRTKSLWLCAALHAIFDCGGLLIADLGTGDPHDTVFIVLTAVIGVLCAIHVAIAAFRMQKRDQIHSM